jgi:CheY-like chemotaxis protein
MLRRLIGANVSISIHKGVELWKVNVDPGQIEQVVVNLAVNARDAMPNGGKLVIETRNVVLAESASTKAGAHPGRYVVLSVADDGCGMDEPTKRRLFEPFFSTKGDKGTGIGLATVYGIVKQSGGFIDVESSLGCGSIFHVYLPEHHEVKPSAGASPPSTVPLRGAETILVAEDENEVRNLLHLFLTSLGYKVFAAKCGFEAVQKNRELQKSVDLLIADVVMPDMSGWELSNALKKSTPSLRTLFVSGFISEEMNRRMEEECGAHVLLKPFTREVLGRKVREVLD